MPAGNPVTQRFYQDLGITCVAVGTRELAKAAAAMACLTGVLQRDEPES